MNIYDVWNAELSIRDLLRYDAVIHNHTQVRDCGDYLMMLVPMKNAKMHDTYRIYYRPDGRIYKIIGDSTNTGFAGTKYY